MFAVGSFNSIFKVLNLKSFLNVDRSCQGRLGLLTDIAKLSLSSSPSKAVLVLFSASPSSRPAGRPASRPADQNSTFWSELDFPVKSKVVSLDV